MCVHVCVRVCMCVRVRVFVCVCLCWRGGTSIFHTCIVFWSKLSQLFGIGECLCGPAGGDE